MGVSGTRGERAWIVLASLLLLNGAGCATRVEEKPRAPRIKNLVVVMIDTLRSDHLASYGYGEETTPFLTRLAAESVQLQGYSASSWTRPSVATFLTGLYPQRHEAISRSDRLPGNVPYLPSLLRESGIQTAAYMSNGNVGEEVGFSRGYEIYRESIKSKLHAAAVTDGALELAKDLRSPFFLYVHYIDPHDPYIPKQVWNQPEIAEKDYVQPKDFLSSKYPMQGAQMERLRGQYDGEIHEMDAAIERLIDGLRAAGLLEHTLVVVTADHGEEFGEHGSVAHGHHLYEEVVQVPFLLWSEGGLTSYRSDAPFHHVDFVPTVLDAMGLPPRPGLDGSSRWGEIVARNPSRERPMLFHLDIDRFGELALISPPYKLIQRMKGKQSLLYDLATDAGEEDPLESENEKREELARTVVEKHNALSEESSGRVTTTLSPGLKSRLAALGYIPAETTDPKLSERVVPPHLTLGKAAPVDDKSATSAAE